MRVLVALFECCMEKVVALGLPEVLFVGSTRRFTTCGYPRILVQLQLPVFIYGDDLVRQAMCLMSCDVLKPCNSNFKQVA